MGSLRISGLLTVPADQDALLELVRTRYPEEGSQERQAAVMTMGFAWNTAAYLTRHDMELPAPPQTGGTIIAVVPFRQVDDYKFLKLVLVEYPGKIVSWMHNSDDGGFHGGEYTTLGVGKTLTEEVQGILRSEALLQFSSRVARELR